MSGVQLPKSVVTTDNVTKKSVQLPNTFIAGELTLPIPYPIPPIAEPDLLPSIAPDAIETPVNIAANALDPSTPPFARNHARILYENLAINSTVLVSGGTNGNYVLVPNTYQAWAFSGTQDITLTLPANQNIDTICIGAHNLSGASIDVGISLNAGSIFTEFASGISPVNNNAIMFHIDEAISVRRIKLTITGAADYRIGWITAGIALQMARPFFSGHNPMDQNKKTRYFDAWTETGQMVGRSKRSVQLMGDFSWENLPDTWYRNYMPAFIESATQLPYIIAWNLLEYPLDVAMAFTDEDINSSYSGTRNLRSVSFSARGIA